MARFALALTVCLVALAASANGTNKVVEDIDKILDVVYCAAEDATDIGDAVITIVNNTRKLVDDVEDYASTWEDCGTWGIVCKLELVKTVTENIVTAESDILATIDSVESIVEAFETCIDDADD